MGLTEFKKARMPVETAARALGMDAQTVRVMCQLGIVPWGFAFKPPGSKYFSYIISLKLFCETTGFRWDEGIADEK